MGFLEPRNLVWALAIGALVLIYLRSRSRPTLEVSSLMLFDQTPAPVASVRHVRLDALFWVELAGLTALVLAVAGMYAMAPARAGRVHSHALVFDLGAAMSARDGSGTRLDEARRKALEIVARARPGDEFSVITYALEAQVAAPQTANLAVVRRAIADLDPFAVAAAAAALDAALIRARGASEIDLFTDRAPSAEVIGASGTGGEVRVYRVGGDDDNLGIAALDPGAIDSTHGRAIVRNFSAAPHLIELAIDLDGREILKRPLMLAPREQASVSFGPLKSSGVLHARILTADAIAADNERWALVRSDAPERVLVLSRDAGVQSDLARVLLAINPNFQVETAGPDTYPSTKPPGAGTVRPYDLAVMHDCYLPAVAARSMMLIYPPPISAAHGVREPNPYAGKIPGFEIDGTARSAGLSSEHGAEPVGGAGAALGATRIMRLPNWMNALAYATFGNAGTVIPIVAEGEVTGGRVAVVAFDVRGHLLFDPDRLGALIAVVNATHRITAPAGVLVVSTGTFASLAVDGAARVTQPDGAVVTLEPDRWGRIRLQPLEAGRYVVESKHSRTIVLANYYDAAESDLMTARAAAHQMPSAAAQAPLKTARPRQVMPLGFILIAIAAGALLAESILLVGRASRWGMTHV